MCGIFGWDFNSQQADTAVSKSRRLVLATVLGMLNDNRGGDSWGFASPTGVERGLSDIAPSAFLMAKNRLVMGHTRKRTMGAISIENAHPFEIGKIIGAHNGMVYNHTDLKRKYTDREKFEVDSMHLFAHINEDKDMAEIEGYGAIEFFEKTKPEKIYLCKMRQGDLSVVGVGKGPEDYDGVIWSSNKDHLKKALDISGLKAFSFDISDEQVYFVNKGRLFFHKEWFIKISSTSTTQYRGHGRSESESWQDETWGMYGFSSRNRSSDDSSYTTVTNQDGSITKKYSDGTTTTVYPRREEEKKSNVIALPQDKSIYDRAEQQLGGFHTCSELKDHSITTCACDCKWCKTRQDEYTKILHGLMAEEKKNDGAYLSEEFASANSAIQKELTAIVKQDEAKVVSGIMNGSNRMKEVVLTARNQYGLVMPNQPEWNKMTEAQRKTFLRSLAIKDIPMLKNLLTEVRKES